MGEPSVRATTPGTPMRRIAAACLVGSAIEFYDFLIYGTAAALVFPAVFFPRLGPTVATIASMATFATAFLSRPLGAAVFGYFGDRLGRKKTLVATLLIMGASTVSVGLVPSTASIGIAAPLLLTVLRLLQGFAVGGEWAGSVLLSAEYAPTDRRGWYGMFTLLGGGTAGILASLTFLAVNLTMGEHSPAFMHWGWRVPFLISSGLIGIALYVRLNIDETPIFVEEKARHLVPKAPLTELLRLQRREIILVAGSFVGGMGFIYLGNTFLVMYAHNHLGYSRSFIWGIGALGGLTSMACVACSAWISDRVGRRRVMLWGLVACLPWAFVVIPLIDTGRPVCYVVAVLGMFGTAAGANGPPPPLV
ncbi:MFS transporter, partial [Mycobacterium avium]|uniref:MFS transporter n=1 Tax=Mycobacterium avium TaxID=1764 RepID=UPI0006811E4E